MRRLLHKRRFTHLRLRYSGACGSHRARRLPAMVEVEGEFRLRWKTERTLREGLRERRRDCDNPGAGSTAVLSGKVNAVIAVSK